MSLRHRLFYHVESESTWLALRDEWGLGGFVERDWRGRHKLGVRFAPAGGGETGRDAS